MDSSQFKALGDQHFREEAKQNLLYNNLQKVQGKSHASSKATYFSSPESILTLFYLIYKIARPSII